MNCNCSNWEDDKPCQIHPHKLTQPELVLHEMQVVRVYRRYSSRKWFYTVAKDAVRVFESPEQDQRPKIVVTQTAIEPPSPPTPT